MAGKAAGGRFQTYWANVQLRAAVLAVIGVLLLYWATSLDPGVEQKFLEGVGVAILTGAVVSLVMSGKLSKSLSEEILSTVEEQSTRVVEVMGHDAMLQSSGIVGVLSGAPDWDDLLSGAQEIVLLSTRPNEPDQDWAAALQTARTRPTSIDVHIPSATSPNLNALADRFGEPAAVLAAHLSQLPDTLFAQWQAVSPPHGSQLRLFTFDGVPGFAIARADARCAVVVPTIAGSRAGERLRTFIVTLDRDESWSAWLADQLASLDAGLLNQQRVP